jgi:hypothetical protein
MLTAQVAEALSEYTKSIGQQNNSGDGCLRVETCRGI